MTKSIQKSPLKILAILPALIPSSIILVVEPLLYLAKAKKVNLRVRLEGLYVSSLDLKWADGIVFCRNTDPAFDPILEQVLMAHKPYIYEIDDNFFELPLDVNGGEYHRAPEQIAQLEKYLTNASLVRVYSLPMETRTRQYTSRVKLVKAPVNLSSIPAVPPHRNSERLKLVYTTSRSVEDDLSQILVNDLKRILTEYADLIEVHFWGYVPKELKGYPSVKFHSFISDYKKYIQTFYQQGYDIGLAPMRNDLFYRSKTNNKFREFGACWIAGIYSNSEIYANCVEAGKTGLLVSNADGEWYKAILALMQDTSLRQAIQKNTRALVECECSLDPFASLLWEDIQGIVEEVKATADPKNNRTQTSDPMDPGGILVHKFQKVNESVKTFGVIYTLGWMLRSVKRDLENLV